MDSYPLLNLLVNHGRKLALVLGIFALVLGLLATIADGLWSWTFLGAIAAVLVYGFVASYAELVRLVTDMLLPK